MKKQAKMVHVKKKSSPNPEALLDRLRDL